MKPSGSFSDFLGSSPWVVSGSFFVLGSEFFSLGCSWCFLRLEIFIFLLGLFQVFRNFNVKVWSVSCVIGLGPLGSCVLYFSCPTDPSLSAGPGVVPFARLFAFLPSRRPPHSVRGHGLGNRAAKLRHGTVGFSCSSFLSSCQRPPQLRAGGRPG